MIEKISELKNQELTPKTRILLSLFVMEKTEANLSFISRQELLTAAQDVAPEITEGKNLYSYIKPLIDAKLIKEGAPDKQGHKKYSLTKNGEREISRHLPLSGLNGKPRETGNATVLEKKGGEEGIKKEESGQTATEIETDVFKKIGSEFIELPIALICEIEDRLKKYSDENTIHLRRIIEFQSIRIENHIGRIENYFDSFAVKFEELIQKVKDIAEDLKILKESEQENKGKREEFIKILEDKGG